MSNKREVQRIIKSRSVTEGAGVRLKRAIGFLEPELFDPFLLLDDFHSDNPADYLAGFPWHPHRGIETITYVLKGRIEHGDSLGNSGVIGEGDVQWMTAGSGIVHQEMPEGSAKDAQAGGRRLQGFQLWANLPRIRKMMDPRYQEIKQVEIPVVELPGGSRVRVICGAFGGVAGPVKDVMINPQYLDVSLAAEDAFTMELPEDHTALAYVIEGDGRYESESLLHFSNGTELSISAPEKPLRFLFISGKPLSEPIAWGGPIVMNTKEELDQAFREYREGTFLKVKG
ncbi:MAG: pirin family protein [Spirochaetales bacterium]|nr:MAG: pirin family protein [Spirochaetales bacterium]